MRKGCVAAGEGAWPCSVYAAPYQLAAEQPLNARSAFCLFSQKQKSSSDFFSVSKNRYSCRSSVKSQWWKANFWKAVGGGHLYGCLCLSVSVSHTSYWFCFSGQPWLIQIQTGRSPSWGKRFTEPHDLFAVGIWKCGKKPWKGTRQPRNSGSVGLGMEEWEAALSINVFIFL